MGWHVSLIRWGREVVKFVRRFGSICVVWCMNVECIVMVCSCGGGGGMCVIPVVIVVGWLGNGGGCMVVVVLVMR